MECILDQELFQRAMQQLRAEMGDTKSFRAFRAVRRPEPARRHRRGNLDLHITSVYRAKREVTTILRQTRASDERSRRGLD